ncbi:MAG: SDR family oxidoreductase [Acidobacteriota bacterium]
MKITANTRCLVTGASSGIGRAIALELARRGAKVALTARSQESLEKVAEEVNAAGGQGLALPCDVTNEAAVAELVERVAASFGGLDLLVANAGLGKYAAVEEQGPEVVDITIQTNYVGMTRTVRHALPHLLASSPGHVVGVTSSAGIIPHTTAAAYAASKAASNMYLDVLRLEVADRGVGVTKICPGAVQTPFLEKADLDPKKDLPLLARWLVRTLSEEEVARATVRAVERNRGEVVQPFMLGLFALFQRTAPALAGWVQRKTG